MPREVTGGDGVRWSCAQAYAGVSGPAGQRDEAARVEGARDTYEVVCTPSGGAQTVRLELKGGWEESYSDEELLREIEARRE